MKKILVLLLAFTSTAFGASVERPSQKYPDQAVNNYSWLTHYDRQNLSISLNENATRFISESEVERYFKLKLRNFIRDIKVIKSAEDLNYNYVEIELELFKYNDKTKINYGLLSLKLYPSVMWEKGKPEPYNLTMAIAGSEAQLNSTVKETLDMMVEVLAEDYYFVLDTKAE